MVELNLAPRLACYVVVPYVPRLVLARDHLFPLHRWLRRLLMVMEMDINPTGIHCRPFPL